MFLLTTFHIKNITSDDLNHSMILNQNRSNLKLIKHKKSHKLDNKRAFNYLFFLVVKFKVETCFKTHWNILQMIGIFFAHWCVKFKNKIYCYRIMG